MISVIIPCWQDTDNCRRTIASIRAHATRDVEIIVVDDSRSFPLDDAVVSLPGLRVVTPHRRLGCGGARHYGALCAKGDSLLFTDSHVWFPPGWDAHLGPELVRHYERDVLCTVYNVLHEWPVDSCATIMRQFGGASWELFHYTDGRVELLPIKLEPFQPDQRVPYAMPLPVGAGYLVNRMRYLVHADSPLRWLNGGWGGDEEMLALGFKQVLIHPGFNLHHVTTICVPGRTSAAELLRNKLIVLARSGFPVNRMPGRYILDAGLKLQELPAPVDARLWTENQIEQLLDLMHTLP